MARSKSSRRWLNEHFDDAYVKQAQSRGLRSRAALKLEQLQKKYRLVKPGMVVVDLGAAPGGWSQMAAEWVGDSGRVIALDILAMDALAGVEFIEGDFTESEPLAELESLLDGAAVDLVLSDMSPNISGMRAVDQPRAMYLIELAHDFARHHLKRNGDLLVKMFQGEGADQFLDDLRGDFKSVRSIKPDASRSRSREVYVLAKNFNGT